MSESKRGGAQLARAVEKAYQAGQDDYHLEPMVLVENSKQDRRRRCRRVLLPPR